MEKLTGYCAVAEVRGDFGIISCYAIYDDGHTYKNADKVYVSIGLIETISNIVKPDKATEAIIGEVICKVDTSTYDERVKKRKKIDDISKEIEKIICDKNKDKIYEYYANKDPLISKLYNEYRRLKGE